MVFDLCAIKMMKLALLLFLAFLNHHNAPGITCTCATTSLLFILTLTLLSPLLLFLLLPIQIILVVDQVVDELVDWLAVGRHL